MFVPADAYEATNPEHPQQPTLSDFMAQADTLSAFSRKVTLGEAKDRIAQLTQLLARKEYQLLFVNKEKEFYRKAFEETRKQNSTIRDELAKF